MKSFALLALLAGSLCSQGQTASRTGAFSYRFSGYYRSLLTSSHSFYTGDPYGDSLNRVRLSLDASWRHSLVIHVDYDNLLHIGNLIGEPDFDLVRDRQDTTYLDLLHVILNDKNAYWDTSLYRGYLMTRRGRVELTAGRQRIAWGTARFWSPADVFNPISPLEVEEDERVGVDAAQLELWLPKDAHWPVVYAPQDGISRSTEATHIGSTVHNLDIAAFGGRFQKDWLVGGDFAGQWRGAGLRGELTYTFRATPGQANPLRLTLGSDYAINNKWYVLGEYFYNQGQPPGYSPGQPFDPSILLRYSTEIYTLQRHFVSAGARYSVTPLLTLQTYAVTDIAGPSIAFMPEASYDLTANTNLRIGGQIFASFPSGEFNDVPNLFDAEFTVHF